MGHFVSLLTRINHHRFDCLNTQMWQILFLIRAFSIQIELNLNGIKQGLICYSYAVLKLQLIHIMATRLFIIWILTENRRLLLLVKKGPFIVLNGIRIAMNLSWFMEVLITSLIFILNNYWTNLSDACKSHFI